MSNIMTETQVLNWLGIQDFRHMTKDKVVAFASMLHDMDPEVAKRAIEQFPNFCEMALQLLTQYRGTIQSLSESNKEISEYCLGVLNGIAESLGACIARDDITTEERVMYADNMMEIVRTVAEIDRSSKESSEKSQLLVSAAIFILGALASAILGNNIRFKSF